MGRISVSQKQTPIFSTLEGSHINNRNDLCFKPTLVDGINALYANQFIFDPHGVG